MTLSKAFNSLNHELLLTKVKAYSLDRNSVILMQSYIKCKKIWTKVFSNKKMSENTSIWNF